MHGCGAYTLIIQGCRGQQYTQQGQLSAYSLMFRFSFSADALFLTRVLDVEMMVSQKFVCEQVVFEFSLHYHSTYISL